jgi:CFEM domain
MYSIFLNNSNLKVECFCTAHSFHEKIAPCITVSCDAREQQQTEQYAKGICNAVGIDLPSFKELLSYQFLNATPITNASSISETNSTSSSQNGTRSTSSAVLSSETASASASAIGTVSKNAAGQNKVQIAVDIYCLIAAGIGLGMFIA